MAMLGVFRGVLGRISTYHRPGPVAAQSGASYVHGAAVAKIDICGRSFLCVHTSKVIGM